MKSRLFLLFVFAALLPLQSCYILKQGTGQMGLRLSQVPLEQAIESEQNLQNKKLLAAVPGIKQYAIKYLKLKQNSNYSTYYATEEEGIAYIVTASPKIKLESFTWWFPIVGAVPYKGYFDKEDALELEEELKQKGYDTWMFAAPAYSTLGWFKDPLTTPMLKRGHYALAATLIHEMVHTTLYVKGEGDFNEQLASFIENKGAISYFQYQGLLTEDALSQLRASRKTRKEFLLLVAGYISSLSELYANSVSDQEKLEQRKVLFKELEGKTSRLYPGRPEGYWKFNNARLLQYKRYREDSELFQTFWQESGQDWTKFWQLVKAYVEKQDWEY